MECSCDEDGPQEVYQVNLEEKNQRSLGDESGMCCNAEDPVMRGLDVDMLRTNRHNVCAGEIDSAEGKLLECVRTDLPPQEASRVGPVGVKVETPDNEDVSSQLGSGGNAGGCGSAAVLQSHHEIAASGDTEIAQDGNCDGKLSDVIEGMCVTSTAISVPPNGKDTLIEPAVTSAVAECEEAPMESTIAGEDTSGEAMAPVVVSAVAMEDASAVVVENTSAVAGEDTLSVTSAVAGAVAGEDTSAVAVAVEDASAAAGSLQNGTLADSEVADSEVANAEQCVSEEYIRPQYGTIKNNDCIQM